ncbi:aldolase/citrate lyase family protein [Gordonia humi]
MWIASGDTYTAEICAGAGLDWLLLDLEHAPNDIRSTLAQLQATAAYPVHVVVRAPDGDPVMIKRLLDIGVTDLMVPMVDTAEEAAALVAATRYPPAGIRGVGSALSRASRWNRTPGYLTVADTTVSLTVQVESTAGLAELPAITRTDGVDAVFIGPADLAASMGHLGRPEHPDVVATIARSIGIIKDAGAFAGVNAFNPDLVETYTAAGADFVLVGADVAILARGSEALATRYITDSTHPTLDSGAH